MVNDGEVAVVKEEEGDGKNDQKEETETVDVDNEPSPPSMLPLHGLQSMFDTIDYLIVQDGYQCAACPGSGRRSFPDMPALRRHMVRHVKGGDAKTPINVANKELLCNHCNRTFERVDQLRKHLLEALNNEYGPGRSDSDDSDDDDDNDNENEDDGESIIYIVKNGRLTCSACDAEFGPVSRWNREKFKLHVGEVHWKPSPHKCNECGKRFNDPDKLGRHILRHAKSQEVGWMGSQPSTSGLAENIKKEEQDPIDSTVAITANDEDDEVHDPMDILQPEVQVKVEVQDGDEPHEYTVEGGGSESPSSESESSESDSDSDYKRRRRRGKKRKVKTKTMKAKIKRPAAAREIPGGEDGSIILACRLCDEGFLVQELLDRHMAQKHDDRERPFQCSECSKTYLTNGSLQEHIRMAHSGVKFTCTECGLNLSTKSALKRHMQGHTAEGYFCEICKEKFSSHTVLVRHKRRIHEKTPKNFICLDCGSTYDDNASLSEHRLSHTNIRKWECETCGMKFKRSHNLSIHRKTHLVEKKPLPTVKCEECDETFTTKMALTAHRYVHGRFVCKLCKKVFETQSGLIQHRKDIHKLIKHHGTECRTCHQKFQNSEELLEHREQEHADDPLLECPICKATYSTPAALRTHSRYHDKVILYNCVNCPEVFNSQLLLDRHLKVDHKNEKNHICDLCGKGFPTKRQIAAHLIRHKKPPQKSQCYLPGSFICDICGKEFRFRMTLNRHVFNTHTNQNNFKCEQCDKVLSSAEGLKLHMRYHSDDQSIMCEICGRAFLQPYRLKVHMESHMREGNDYRCHICSRSCRDPQKLEKHMKLHTGETQFNCKLCQRFFVTKRHYKLHMQRIHETEVKCLRCDKMFPSAKKMRLHIKIHDFPDYLECPKCFTCVKDKKTMGRHMQQHEYEGIRFPCHYCPLTFVSKKTRRRHERVIHSDKTVQLVGHQMTNEDEEEEEGDGEDDEEEVDHYEGVEVVDDEAYMALIVEEREDEVSVG